METCHKLTFVVLIVLIGLELFCFPVACYASNEQEFVPAFQKGLSYSAWSSDAFGTSESDKSLRLVTQTNTEWIALCFSWVQSSTTSSDIHIDTNSPSVASVQHAIATAHRLGLKVMLKPMVEPLMREENLPYPVWRGEIQPSDSWFDSYRIFINYFAEFAQQNSVEMFCVGCEYKATTDESEQWQRVIQGVRDRYSGPITYAADWTNYYNIDWWNSVDYVGIDAYFPLSIFDSDPTATQLQKVWTNYADEIEEWLEPINKPVIFTEIGYRSGDGTNMAPSNYWSDMSLDLQEQQDCYQTAFQTLWDKDWFYGFYWWTWIHDPTKGGLTDTSHTPQNKPTQDLITEWYAKDVQIAVIDQTVVSATVSSVNQHQSVMFHAKWQQNNADVADAKVYVNRTELTTNSTGWAKLDVTYSTVGKRSWVVTDIDHPQATRYTNAAPVPSIVWDELTVTVEAESSEFFSSNIKVTLLQEYTQTPVTGATVTVNGKLCEELAGGVYSLSINSWSPIEQLAVVVETDSMPARTVSSTVFLVMNTVFYGVIIGLALMVLFVFLKRRHVSPSSG